VVEKAAGAKDVVAPLGAKGVVHHDEDLAELEHRDNPLEEGPREELDVELELGGETIEVALVYGEASSMARLRTERRPCCKSHGRATATMYGQLRLEKATRRFITTPRNSDVKCSRTACTPHFR
jgi:hypothetical protein